MPAKQQIRAKEVVESIVTGLTDRQLMEKYRLTPKGLQSVFRKLFALKLLDRSRFYHRLSSSHLSQDSEAVRKLDRQDLLLPLQVIDVNNPLAAGIVTDLTPEGVGVRGMPANVGEVKRLKVLTDEFFRLDPFVFKAECRWAKPKEKTADQLCGFEITRISDTDKTKLQNLLETIDYMWRTRE